MGKKAKKSPGGPTEVSEDDAAAISSFKEEGTKCFGRKEYVKAIESYEKALKLLPEGHPDKALLHSNKAACHMMLKKYKESINDCTAALDVAPTYFKALCRRAKAYEQLGLYKQALGDIQKANKTQQASEETQETEKRLRDQINGKRPMVAANGAARKAVPPRGARQHPIYVQAKCTLGEEMRTVHMTMGVTYAELLEAVHQKFPGCGPVALKYLDREGDLVTITDKLDLQKGMAELVEAAGLGSHGPRLPTAPILPALKIQVVKVGSQDEVPKPPADETRALQQMKLVQEAHQKQQAAQQNKAQNKEQTEEVFELDEWLVEFAQLFREMLGVDPEKHLELHTLGYDKCTEALDAAVQSDKALPLFDKAAERFQEVTANGLLNWGNVHMCVARKYIEEAAGKGQTAASVIDKVEAELKKAEHRYNQSLEFKPDYYDSYIATGQLWAERAKLAAGFIFAQPKPEPKEGEDPKEAEKATLQRQLEVTAIALKKLVKEDVESAKEHFDKALGFFEKAFESLPEEEKNKEIKKADDKAKEPPKEAPKDGQPQEEEVSLKAHTLVVWGNLLYEISQVRAAVGQTWKPLLDDAVSKFREAGCSEVDIRQALLNHSKREEIDIPPEPEKPATPAVKEVVKQAAKESPKEEVKGGLAALPKKK